MGRPKKENRKDEVLTIRISSDTLTKLKEEAIKNNKTVSSLGVEIIENHLGICIHKEKEIRIQQWSTSLPLQEGQIVLDTNNEEKVIGKSHTSTNLKLPLRATDLFYYKGKQTRITALAHRQKISIEEVRKQLRSEGYE